MTVQRKILASAIIATSPAFALNGLFKFPTAGLSQKYPKVLIPDGFTAPEPVPLGVRGDYKSLVTSSITLLLKLGTGISVIGWSPSLSLEAPEEGAYALKLGPLFLSDTSAVLRDEVNRPTAPITIYEYDASPFCRKVRDACAVLDLTVEFRPCPGARAGFSDELFELTGRRTVPYMVDQGTGVDLFESDDIIAHLFDKYGPGADKVPAGLKGNLAVVTSGLAAVARSMPASRRQADARPDNEQMRPLTLYGYEISPFVKPVREKLCALALPHTMVHCARGSANRAALIKRTGKQFQVPYLVDPNTGVELFESIEIQAYLDAAYTTK
mmetsp:Transcript_30361/g.61816  ORF Transcript_30361/g.61816 Transcript_30361/m.61816 type:complete len:327 (+) Transcript_30361:69-1049(+)|eukprot:CAMPEP_0171780884 /NCGR_PEP_ID=MMETSP0991-20121206/59887_1 /TAXON_ID=483369 /ORGANISM="non described non described, Strain CCMP2098" /LENGTH=326 /DNA_ID=CAMNT_0012388363 /DNA_START=1 /DNA_END=981 /DNA_ORIENTATION=+